MRFLQRLGLVTSFLPSTPGGFSDVPVKSKKHDRIDRILLRAESLIKERGWTKFKDENQHGNLCLIGAINMAAMMELNELKWYEKPFHSSTANTKWYWQACDRVVRIPEVNLVVQQALEKHPFASRNIYHYNDSPSVTKDDVRSVLRKAASA